MPRKSLLSCSLCLFLVAFVPEVVRAADVIHYKYKEGSAFASFHEEGPCSVTDVFVFASSSATRISPQSSTGLQMAAITVTTFDMCRQVANMIAVGDIQTSGFQADPNLQTATLHAVIPVYDFATDRIFDIQVDLAWKAVGPQTLVADHGIYDDPPFKVRTQVQGRSRPAQAVGTVRVGTTDLAPHQSTEGFTQWVQIGEITITRGE